jgi:hypothetical protein
MCPLPIHSSGGRCYSSLFVAFQLGNILSRKNGSDTVNASNKKYIRKGWAASKSGGLARQTTAPTT